MDEHLTGTQHMERGEEESQGAEDWKAERISACEKGAVKYTTYNQ